MAWDALVSGDGIYYVDWRVVGRMIRSYVRSGSMLSNIEINKESHWAGPTVHTFNVNWDKVAKETDRESEARLADFYRGALINGQRQICLLAEWVEQTSENNSKFQKAMRDAQRQTMENIDKSVGRLETGLTISKGLRDISAEFLMISATMVTGGAAGALLATGGGLTVGAGLKATATYQDDPHASKRAVAATFASELAVGLIDLGGAKAIGGAAERAAEAALKASGSAATGKVAAKLAEKSTKLGLGILWGQAKGLTTEPGKAIIQGKTLQQGLVTGQMKSVGGTHGELLKYLVLDDENFPKLAAVADTTISFLMDKVADRLNEPKEENRSETEQKRQAVKIPKPIHLAHPLLDAVAYDKEMVQRTAMRQIGSAGPPVTTSERSFGQVKSGAGLRR